MVSPVVSPFVKNWNIAFFVFVLLCNFTWHKGAITNCPAWVLMCGGIFSCRNLLLRLRKIRFNPHSFTLKTLQMMLASTPYIVNSQTIPPICPSCLLPPLSSLLCHHLWITYLLMMCCKRLLLCFQAALSPLHPSPLHFLIPQHPPSSCSQPLTPPLLTPSRWKPLIGRYQLNSRSTWSHRGEVSGVCSSQLSPLPPPSPPWTPGPWFILTRGADAGCSLSSAESSLSLRGHLFLAPFHSVSPISLFLIHSCHHF